MTLTPSRIDELTHIADRALECSSVHELQTRTLALLEPRFQADACCFAVNRGRRWDPDYERTASRGLDASIWRRYRSYGDANPFEHWLTRNACDPRVQVVTTDRIIPLHRYVRSDFYKSVMRPRSLHYTLGMTLLAGGRPLGAIALLRSQRARPFSEGEVDMAQVLVRILAAVLDGKLARETDRVQESIIAALEQVHPHGLALVDHRLQLRYANDAACRMVPAFGAGRVPAELQRPCRVLLRRRYQRSGEETRIALDTVNGDCRHPLQACLSLRTDAGDEEPWLLLRIAASGRIPPKPEAVRAHQLTVRESQVAALLGQGMRNAEIGTRLGITVRTVENHLRAVYRKLGVGNRTRAIYALSQFEAPAAAAQEAESVPSQRTSIVGV